MSVLSVKNNQLSSTKIFHLLQVEGDAAYARLVASLLKESERYQVELLRVSSLKAAFAAVHKRAFDAILLDPDLPDSQGLVTLERLCYAVPELPVVLLANTKHEAISLQAIQYGAQDYLIKGEFDSDLLICAICYAIDRKQVEIDLARLAQYDPLTGLANRQLFVDRLEQAIIRARRNRSLLGLLYMDLDHFKSINDSLGHDFGDLLLEQTAGRIQKTVRARDTVARLGGDEFTVILENVATREAVSNIAENVIESISERYLVREHEIFTNTSMGVTMFDGEDIDAKHLIKQADVAMYRAKQHAGNKVLFFDAKMDVDSKTRIRIKMALRNAMLRDEFDIEYQPQIDVGSGKIFGAEALLRWRNGEFSNQPVSEIISILEQTGMISSVGEWVLNAACAKWQSWRRCGYVDEKASISVNLSARQFWQRDIVAVVKQALRHSGLPPHLLDLELTENLLLKNTERNIGTLSELRALGVSATIDDFGTGLCSMIYLKHFPITRLKIDRTFIKGILDSEQDRAIASAIIELAQNLKLKVIAEGVDNWEQVKLLHARGCCYFQGFQFSRPLPEERFLERCRMLTHC